MKVTPYSTELEPAVGRFNKRLTAGGYEEFVFPERHRDAPSSNLISRDYFVAVDDNQEVRGGYIIRRQPFFKRGQAYTHPFLKLPVSEGIVNRRYATVGVELLQDAVDRAPSIFALGMGGVANPLPQLLESLGWRVVEVPFYYKIKRSGPVLQSLEPFRRTRLRRFAAGIARFTGIAHIASSLLFPRQRPDPEIRIELESEFGDWVDPVWFDSKDDYGLLAERSQKTLEALYRPFTDLIRILRVCRDDKTIGWTVCLVTKMQNHRHFQDLKVATLADGLAPKEAIEDVVRASVHYLETEKPDLILSNQYNRHWQNSLRRSGFRSGPSNFAWAVSPEVSPEFERDPSLGSDTHINRGDGDGPIHL